MLNQLVNRFQNSNFANTILDFFEDRIAPIWTWLRKYIFTFNRPRHFWLAWHWRLQDGSWDINLSFLLLPVIIWMFVTGVNGWIIFLACLSTFYMRVPARK